VPFLGGREADLNRMQVTYASADRSRFAVYCPKPESTHTSFLSLSHPLLRKGHLVGSLDPLLLLNAIALLFLSSLLGLPDTRAGVLLLCAIDVHGRI